MYPTGLHFLNSGICIALLFLLSDFGSKRGWYQKKGNWFSRVMHFSGGFLVAMFWSGLTGYISLILALTILVGVLWEFWEYFCRVCKHKKTVLPKGVTLIRDTAEDLILDTAGAVVFTLLWAYL